MQIWTPLHEGSEADLSCGTFNHPQSWEIDPMGAHVRDKQFSLLIIPTGANNSTADSKPRTQSSNSVGNTSPSYCLNRSR